MRKYIGRLYVDYFFFNIWSISLTFVVLASVIIKFTPQGRTLISGAPLLFSYVPKRAQRHTIKSNFSRLYRRYAMDRQN